MFNHLPPLTRTLIIVNVVVFIAQQPFWGVLVAYFALWPLGSGAVLGGLPGFELWQLVSYAFLHGSLTHLFFNMFGLYMFGSEVERVFGPRRYMQLYFAAVISAALAQLVFAGVGASLPHPTMGASGGVFGLLLAFGLFFPRRMIVLLIPPIPMPAWLFVTLYGALELFLGVTGTQAGVAHFAHLGGMLGAGLTILYWRRGPPQRRR